MHEGSSHRPPTACKHKHTWQTQMTAGYWRCSIGSLRKLSMPLTHSTPHYAVKRLRCRAPHFPASCYSTSGEKLWSRL